MIAAENETLARAAQDGLHAAPVGFDACRARIVEAASVHGAPEVAIEFEIGAAPLLTHGAKDHLQMFLGLQVRAIERIPRPAPPAAERDAVGAQRLALIVFHKPIGVLFEEMRILFRDEWGDPDGRLEAAFTNLFEHALHVSAEGRSRFQPISHRWLIPVINSNVSESRYLLVDEIQVVEHLLGSDFRAETI